MVFSSAPLYLDPPNWDQQHHNEINQISPQVLPPSAHSVGGGALVMGGGPTAAPSSTRAGSSMTDRARLAKIPVPEGPLKCPRCESANTKFCYFNNYSLTQPRHFCKTCRRYWTRGGSLRSVPVGGGCRRNKRKKSGRAPKSPSKIDNQPRQTPTSASPIGSSAEFSSGGQHHHLLQGVGSIPPPPYSFMASLQNLTQLGMGNLGLNFGALGVNTSDLHLGNYGDHELAPLQGSQPQHLSNLLAGFGSARLASTPSIYPFQNTEGMETASFGKGMGMGVPHHIQQQQQSVKMEMGQQQFWSSGSNTTGTSGGLWTDLTGICSSSTPTHRNILR